MDRTPPLLLDSVRSQARVLRALTLREMQARFGRENVGFLWMIFEPMMFAGGVTLIHYFSDAAVHSPGIGPYPFTLLGYCLFIIFRNSFNRADKALNGSANLFYHRQVAPLDLLVARHYIEIVGCLCAFVVLTGVGIALGLSERPARPLELLLGIIGISWISFALMLVIAAHTYEGHAISRLVHPFSYLMVPLSGAFITMDFLPSWSRPYMAWNPMMSIFELARYGMFESARPDYIYPGYIIAVCAGLTYWGLLAIRRVRKDIHVG